MIIVQKIDPIDYENSEFRLFTTVKKAAMAIPEFSLPYMYRYKIGKTTKPRIYKGYLIARIAPE